MHRWARAVKVTQYASMNSLNVVGVRASLRARECEKRHDVSLRIGGKLFEVLLDQRIPLRGRSLKPSIDHTNANRGGVVAISIDLCRSPPVSAPLRPYGSLRYAWRAGPARRLS